MIQPLDNIEAALQPRDIEQLNITTAAQVNMVITTTASRFPPPTHPLDRRWGYPPARRNVVEAIVTNEKDIKTLRAILRRANILRVHYDALPF